MCSSLFKDPIYAHSIANIAENDECPDDSMGERIGAFGKLYFPHGRLKCSVVIGSKCGAPAFKLSEIESVVPEDYDIYWAEWDFYELENRPEKSYSNNEIN